MPGRGRAVAGKFLKYLALFIKSGFLILTLIFLLFVLSCKKLDDVASPDPAYPTIDHSPDWSPDGSTIVFSHTHYIKIDTFGGVVDLESTGLWFINPDGSNKRMFLRLLSGGDPVWSPDGQWIAFEKNLQI